MSTGSDPHLMEETAGHFGFGTSDLSFTSEVFPLSDVQRDTQKTMEAGAGVPPAPETGRRVPLSETQSESFCLSLHQRETWPPEASVPLL